MIKKTNVLTYGKDVRDYFLSPDFSMQIDLGYEQRRIAPILPFLEQHGVKFISGPFDYQYPAVGEGRCFDVAAEVAGAFGLHYCEGVVHAPTMDGHIVMMLHGWCCTDDGRVIDPVAYKCQELPGVRYFGVPIKLSYAEEFRKEHGFFGLLDGHSSLGPTVGVYVDSPSVWMPPLQTSATKV